MDGKDKDRTRMTQKRRISADSIRLTRLIGVPSQKKSIFLKKHRNIATGFC